MRYTVNWKKFEFKTFVLKNFCESLTPRILHASIFNQLQLNVHTYVSSRVMDDIIETPYGLETQRKLLLNPRHCHVIMHTMVWLQ